MALLNNYYIFVQDEDVKRGVSISSHPVEKGIAITDNVKHEPAVISIKGEIVGANASTTLDKIADLHKNGKLVKYIGQNIMSNALITSFDTSHPNTIYGGCAFTMEIKEVRIASSPLVTKKTSTKVQVTKKSTLTSNKSTSKSSKTTSKSTSKKYTVKRGDSLWNISKKYYGSGAKYTKIVNANKSLIKNPNVIQVGWKLTIPA